MPYLAQFGLTDNEVRNASKAIRGYLFDQYVRACGFSPTSSWVFIVLPSGDCEFTSLEAGEPYWCCENREQISERVGSPTVGMPPWATETTRIDRVEV